MKTEGGVDVVVIEVVRKLATYHWYKTESNIEKELLSRFLVVSDFDALVELATDSVRNFTFDRPSDGRVDKNWLAHLAAATRFLCKQAGIESELLVDSVKLYYSVDRHLVSSCSEIPGATCRSILSNRVAIAVLELESVGYSSFWFKPVKESEFASLPVVN